MDYVYMDDGEFILVQRSLFHLALANTASFKKKWTFSLNEYSGF